jgi:uncharacterized protein (DUF58 family)
MSETFEMIPAKGGALGLLGIIGLLVLGILILFVFFGYASQHTRFVVSSDGLRITGTLSGRMIPKNQIQVSSVRPVNLEVERQYLPSWRTNGIGLPGYRAGWFKLKNGEKSLLFLTDRSHAVYIPTSNGYSVLASVPDPERFAESLRKNVGTP